MRGQGTWGERELSLCRRCDNEVVVGEQGEREGLAAWGARHTSGPDSANNICHSHRTRLFLGPAFFTVPPESTILPEQLVRVAVVSPILMCSSSFPAR